ncbi:MAG: NAD-dependent epimerase/dehydratase family protein [Magnetospirillum sp. WYHS-4]
MARYTVTGGAGFIGSHLCDALLDKGHEVVVLDDLSGGKRENLPAGAKLLVGDAADPGAVAEALSGAQGCFHLAAIASVARSIAEWLPTHRANQTATVAVLDRAAKQGRIPVVFASSAAVYGHGNTMPLSEGAPTFPLTAYGADKLGSELHASVAWTVHRVPTVGLRFFNVYGPRQDPSSPYSGVVSIFVDRLKRGEALEIHGDGSQVRDFVFVNDVVAHLETAMDNCREGARIYNVCTGTPTTILGLADIMADILGVRPDVAMGPERPGDIRKSLGDPSLARAWFGLSAATGLREGLSRLLAAIPE